MRFGNPLGQLGSFQRRIAAVAQQGLLPTIHQKRIAVITLDSGFYRKRYRDRRYCVMYFALSPLEQHRLPGLLRRLLRLPLFRTKTARMGKIVQVSEEKVD
jgi:hypothetical protein